MTASDRHVVVVLSGGLDSTVVACHALAEGKRVTAVSVNYGQRHAMREISAAREIAETLDIRLHTVDLSGFAALVRGSALTDTQVAVPVGHYTDESMKATIVPNRNAVLLDLAVAVAVAERAESVMFGAHAGDHPIYPDCRPEFVAAFQASALAGNAGALPEGFAVRAPFLHVSKTEVVRIGARLGAPLELTWSCYRGGDVHCGRCGTCFERREAFADAAVPDPTRYAMERGGAPCT